MPHSTLSIREAAAYLHFGEEEMRGLLDAWASRRVLGLPARKLDAFHRRAAASAGAGRPSPWLPDLLQPAYACPALEARTRRSLIRQMVRLAGERAPVVDPEELRRTLEARERQASTALPGGVALLHPEHHHAWLFDASFVLVARTV